MSDLGVAVVTGAARGIGAATAARLARRGHALVLVDVCRDHSHVPYALATRAELDGVAQACRAAGAPVVDVVEDDVAAASVVEAVRAAVGARPVAAAVAAAGVIVGAPGWATSDAAWSALLDANLHGTRRLAEAAVPAMRTAGDGRFVAVASAAALRAMPELAAYSATKAAVVAFVRALAADLAGTGVTANTVCPGSTRGAMLAASAKVYDLLDQEAFAAQQLHRRLLEPDEVAAAIAWLCGPEASALTGAAVPVDGGLSS